MLLCHLVWSGCSVDRASLLLFTSCNFPIAKNNVCRRWQTTFNSKLSKSKSQNKPFRNINFVRFICSMIPAESWTSVGRGFLSISSRILPFFGFFSSSFPTPILLFPPQSRHSRRAMVKKILVKGFPSLSLSVSLFSGVLQSKDLALTNWVWGKRREKPTERRRMERQGDKIYVWGEGVHEWMDEWIQLYDSWVYAFLFSARINREGEGVSKFTSGRIALLSFFVFSSCNGVPTG